MARLLGEAFVAVSPDTKAFREKAAAEIKKALQGIDAKVNMSPETSRLKAKVEAAAKEASKGATARIAVDLRSDQVRAASLRIKALVDDLSAKVARIRVDTEDKEANVKFLRLFANIEALNAKTVRIKTDADVASAFAKLAGLSLEADKLAAKHEIKVDVDQKSFSRLRGLFSRFGSGAGGDFRSSFANRLGDSSGGGGIGGVIRSAFGKASSDGGDKGGSNAAVSFMKRFGSSVVMQSPGITALVVAGLAALPAGLGVVAAGAGIALGGGLMIAAMLEIKRQTKALDAQIKQLTNKKNPTTADKQALADLNNQQAALQKQAAAYNSVNTALANLKSGFLSFAAATTKPLVKPFADALQRIANLMRGPWVGLFKNLFAASAPLVRPFLDMLTNLVDTILPALTQVLTKAGKPIGDLVRNLGMIVGTKIGDWFKAAIPYIKDSGTYLSALVSVLGGAGTFLVKFGGSVARVFMAMAPLFKQLGQSAGFLGEIFFKVIVPAIIQLVGPLSQVVAEVIAAGGAFAKALLPVLIPIADGIVQIVAGILKFVAAHPGLVTAITDIAIAWKLLSLAFSLSPFGLVITAIIVAAALIVHYRKQIVEGLIIAWKWVVNTSKVVWNTLVTFFKRYWPFLLGVVTGGIGLIVGEVILHWHSIVAVTKSIWNGILGFFKGLWGHIENVFTGAAKSVANWAKNAWNSVFRFTTSIWNHIHNWLKTWWTTLVVVFTGGLAIIFFAISKYHTQILHFIERIWNNIFNFFKGIWGHIENVFTDAGKSISNWAVTIWNHIYTVTSSWWNRVFAFFKGIWGHIENVFTDAGKSISNWAVTTWNRIYSVTSSWWNRVFAFFKAIWGHIENVVTGTLKPIQSAISGAWNWISNTTKNIWGHTAAIFSGIWNGLKNTTVNTLNGIKSAVAGAWNSIASTTANLWRKIGSFMAEGVNAGKQALANAINFVTQDLINPIIRGYNAVNNIWNGTDVDGGGPNKGIPKVHFAKGGKVPGFAPGSDTVPAMLSPGEFVVNPVAAKAVGYDRLRALNEAKPGANVRTTRGGMDQFVNGGQILADAVKWNGHPYHWGGPSNPQQGWDCSSFVGYILGHDFGLALPGGAKWNGSTHGPVASSYNNEPGFRLVSHNTKDIQAGDLLVENSGGHVGFGVGPDRMFSAFGTSSGTIFSNASNMTNIYRMGAGGGVFAGAIPGIANAVSPAQQKAYTAYIKLLDKDAKTYSPLSDRQVIQLAKGAHGRAHLHASQGITDHPNYNFTAGNMASKIKPAVVAKYNAAVAAASANFGGNPNSPLGGGTGSNMANGQELYQYLLSNLFGGHKIAAAGATASIWGESNWNPFAQGTGGRGLIGWTPPSKISDATFRGGMKTQLPAIIQFVTQNGDMGVIRQMEGVGTVLEAANLWGHGVERFGINDVHPQGLALATQFMGGAGPGAVAAASTRAAAQAGAIQKHHHLALGGQVPGFAPGSDTVPAMLSPGEFVINPVAARTIGYDTLHALNSQNFAKGGKVSPLQSFEKSVAQMTQAGRLSKLKSLVSLTNTEHNHLANFKPRSASWNSLEHLISLHNQEIAFLEKSGTHLPSPPPAPKPKAKVFPAGPAGVFERKIDSLNALIKSWQARAAADQKSFNVTGFVDAENRIGAITDARNQEQHRLSAFQAKQAAAAAAKKVTPKMRAATRRQAAAARRQAAFNAAVAAVRLTATLKSPQQKAAYYSSPYFDKLADDLMSHSTRPYGIGGASSAAIHGLALGASPDLLNAIYAGDWGGVSTLLRTSDSKQFGVFKSLANTKKKRLATGGVIAGKALGFDVKTGTPFTLGESGRERVMPEQAMNRYEQDKPMTSAQAERLISAVTQLARTTQAGNESTVSALTGIGKGVHRTR
jgi:phage-related protein